jgi:uncharacterized protein YjbI with pentapeptide repeats
MAEFTKYEIYMLLNQNAPLWLSGIDLKDAKLRGGDLRGANLQGAKLSNADLRGANLRGADLYDAYLDEAKLSDAEYDHDTKWPKGYNPITAGAKLEHDSRTKRV